MQARSVAPDKDPPAYALERQLQSWPLGRSGGAARTTRRGRTRCARAPWGSGGGGNGGGGGPRRPRGPRGEGPRPPLKGPEFDELLRQLKDRFNRAFGGSDGRGVRPAAIAAVAGVALAAWALSGLYIVQPDEEAVVTTFGAYSRSEGPGLRYALPSPVEHVEKVSVTNLNRLDIGGTQGADVPQESLMLTGDENIVDLNFSVQWRVSDAARYIFRIADPEATVKMVAESAMREVGRQVGAAVDPHHRPGAGADPGGRADAARAGQLRGGGEHRRGADPHRQPRPRR